jgi:hypothetical protein
VTSNLESAAIGAVIAYFAGELWLWHRVETRIEKHDNKWYDSYPREQVVARYIEVFGHDRTVSFAHPPKAVRLTISVVISLISLALLFCFFTKAA